MKARRDDRSLTGVATLVALYRTDQLISHPRLAMDNRLSVDELAETVTHWPSARAGPEL
jgi:4-carboxymuconolactone decarboxylase